MTVAAPDLNLPAHDNEELVASNEELQSTNEELETTKEEVQSTNEELTTLNEELRNRNQELGALASDLANVFATTPVALAVNATSVWVALQNGQAVQIAF